MASSSTHIESMKTSDATVLETDEARQGERAGVIKVLVASGLGAIFGLALVSYFLL